MRIQTIDVFPLRLPMKAVLTLPRGPSRTLDEGKRTALVRITDGDGNVGWGEASPSRRWSAETLESAVSSIRSYLAPALIGHDLFDLAGAHAKMNQELASGLDPGQPIAKSGIDIALHDLWGKAVGQPIYKLLGGKVREGVRVAHMIGIMPNDDAVAEGEAAFADGIRAFQVKGGEDSARDVDLIRRLRATLGESGEMVAGERHTGATEGELRSQWAQHFEAIRPAPGDAADED